MTMTRNSLKLKLALPVLGAVLVLMPVPAHAYTTVFDPRSMAADIAQWAKEAIQWVQQNLLMSSGNVANNVGQTAETEAIAKSGQAQMDNVAHEGDKNLATDVGLKHSMLLPGSTAASGNDLCSHVMERKSVSNQMDSTRTMGRALEDATRWNGAEGTDTNYKVHMFSLLCKMGAVDKAQHGAAANGCTGSTSYHGGALSKGAVDSSGDYKWPSNITVDSNGKLNIAQVGSDDDAPFNQALANCLLTHPTTSDRTYSDSRQGNAQDLANIFDSMQAQARTNSGVASCLHKLAVHTKVPASAGGQLGQIHQAQVASCIYMHNTGKMNDTDFSACQSDGQSASGAVRHSRCPDIKYTQNLTGTGLSVDDVTKETHATDAACEAQAYSDLGGSNAASDTEDGRGR